MHPPRLEKAKAYTVLRYNPYTVYAFTLGRFAAAIIFNRIVALLHFAEDQEYYDKGICEIHATSKLAVTYPWFLGWMLA